MAFVFIIGNFLTDAADILKHSYIFPLALGTVVKGPNLCFWFVMVMIFSNNSPRTQIIPINRGATKLKIFFLNNCMKQASYVAS